MLYAAAFFSFLAGALPFIMSYERETIPKEKMVKANSL